VSECVRKLNCFLCRVWLNSKYAEAQTEEKKEQDKTKTAEKITLTRGIKTDNSGKWQLSELIFIIAGVAYNYLKYRLPGKF